MAHVLLNAKGEQIAPKVDGPTIEMATVENIAARKFLQFALDDVKFQLTKMSQDTKVSKGEFEDSKTGAVLISAYLAHLITELDRAIAGSMASSSDTVQ